MQSTAISGPKLDAMLRAIADPARRRILALLKRSGCCSLGKRTGLCACDIEQQMELTQPTISHHMAVLRKAGLVKSSKIGLWQWYRREKNALRALTRALREGL
jgi:ArsR family transcriptional regulator